MYTDYQSLEKCPKYNHLHSIKIYDFLNVFNINFNDIKSLQAHNDDVKEFIAIRVSLYLCHRIYPFYSPQERYTINGFLERISIELIGRTMLPELSSKFYNKFINDNRKFRNTNIQNQLKALNSYERKILHCKSDILNTLDSSSENNSRTSIDSTEYAYKKLCLLMNLPNIQTDSPLYDELTAIDTAFRNEITNMNPQYLFITSSDNNWEKFKNEFNQIKTYTLDSKKRNINSDKLEYFYEICQLIYEYSYHFTLDTTDKYPREKASDIFKKFLELKDSLIRIISYYNIEEQFHIDEFLAIPNSSINDCIHRAYEDAELYALTALQYLSLEKREQLLFSLSLFLTYTMKISNGSLFSFTKQNLNYEAWENWKDKYYHTFCIPRDYLIDVRGTFLSTNKSKLDIEYCNLISLISNHKHFSSSDLSDTYEEFVDPLFKLLKESSKQRMRDLKSQEDVLQEFLPQPIYDVKCIEDYQNNLKDEIYYRRCYIFNQYYYFFLNYNREHMPIFDFININNTLNTNDKIFQEVLNRSNLAHMSSPNAIEKETAQFQKKFTKQVLSIVFSHYDTNEIPYLPPSNNKTTKKQLLDAYKRNSKCHKLAVKIFQRNQAILLKNSKK